MSVSEGAATTGPGEATAQRGTGTIAALTLAVLAFSFLQMLVVPAMPVIQADLGVSASDITWLQSAFLLTTAVGTPILGVVGDHFGRRRVLVAVLCVFAAGGAIGVFATSLPWLIVGRAVQGLGGAVFPLCVALVRDAVPARQVSSSVGLLTAMFGAGAAVSLVVTGPLVDHVSWHAIFALAAVIPLVAAAMVWRYVPGHVGRPVGRRRLDWPGGVLLVLAMVPILLGISSSSTDGWSSVRVLVPLAVGAVMTAVWVMWERNAPTPLMDLRLLAGRPVWPLHVGAAAVGFGMYGGVYVIAQLLQSEGVGFGLSVTTTSLLMLPAMVLGFPAATLAGVLGSWFGSRLPLVVGMLAMVAGYALMASVAEQVWSVIVGIVLTQGIGLNLAFTGLANLVVEATPITQSAEAMGVNASARTMGGSVGSQVLGVFVAAGTVTGFAWAFALPGAALLLTLLVMWAVGPALGKRVPRDG
ncbi:MFS transporter [Nocardioides endophyticus]|uniref:MFS transporter n=1 Tax=Nocardioides endophyticus TaxID=1353775 RepID=A0ABP8YRY7_9ACTN